MKTAILAVLLLFAVASIVSGFLVPIYMTNGKSLYGHEIFLFVMLKTLKFYFQSCFLLNHEFYHENVWGNAGKTQGILNIAFRCYHQDSKPVLVEMLRGLDLRVLVVQFPVITKYSSSIHSLLYLTIYPQPLPKRVHRSVRSTGSSFKLQYPLLSLMSTGSCLGLRPLVVTSVFLPFFHKYYRRL